MIPRPRPELFRLRRTMMFMNAQKPGLIKDAYGSKSYRSCEKGQRGKDSTKAVFSSLTFHLGNYCNRIFRTDVL